LWLPTLFGSPRTPGPDVAQLAWALDGAPEGTICGFTFSTHTLPVAEFVRYAPLTRRHAIDVFRALLSSTIVVSCFFPARLSDNRIELQEDGAARVIGRMTEDMRERVTLAARRLRAAFLRAGALLHPTTFKPGATGGDAHYAGTIPMRDRPALGESSADAEVFGLPGVYLADASGFPSLPAKSHTLAIMANADRVGKAVAASL